jgi:AcrR family transcriptional regulator
VKRTTKTPIPHPPFVPPPPPRTPKAARTRELLIDTAAELFIRRGYEAVSMNDIATAAGLTKGAVYGHFRSKGQLLVEVIRWKVAERENRPGFIESTEEPEDGIPLMFDEAGRAVRVLEVDAAAAARHDPDVAAGLAAFYADRHERIRAVSEELADPDTSAWLIAVITAGIGMREAAGVPRPDDAALKAALMAAIDGLA